MNNKFLIAIVINLTFPLNGFGIDIYAPSLPIIKEYFNTTTSLAQLTIGAYLLGFALIQLFIGVICDCVGRRKPYLYSFVLYIITTIIITRLTNIEWLLLIRFVQGLTVGCFVVASRAIIIDVFTGKELQKVSNYVAITWAIGPIVAPTIGSHLQHYFNWQACFYFLCVYALFCITLFYKFVPETLFGKKQFNLSSVTLHYKSVFDYPEFWLCTIITGCIYSLLILFNVVGPFLIENTLHYNIVTYGYVGLIMGLMYFCGSITNRMLHNVDKTIKTNIIFPIMLIIAVLTVLITIKLTTIFTIILPFAIIFYLGGITFSIYYAHSMSIVPKTIAGTAGSLMGATVVIMGATFGSFMGSFLKSSSELPMAFGLLLLIVICYVIKIFENNLILAVQKNDR